MTALSDTRCLRTGTLLKSHANNNASPKALRALDTWGCPDGCFAGYFRKRARLYSRYCWPAWKRWLHVDLWQLHVVIKSVRIAGQNLVLRNHFYRAGNDELEDQDSEELEYDDLGETQISGDSTQETTKMCFKNGPEGCDKGNRPSHTDSSICYHLAGCNLL